MRKWFTFFLIIIRWIVLTLAGGLAYALLRGWWTIITIGAPVYDWLWYLPVIALLVGLLLRTAWNVPRPGLTLPALAGLLILIGIGCNGLGHVIYLQPEREPPIPISFWTYLDFRNASPALLEDIKSAGGYLYRSTGSGPIEGERAQALADGLRRLAEYDIEVYVAPSYSDFLSVPYHHEWIGRVHTVADLVQREGLGNVRGLMGDVEPPIQARLDIACADQANFYQTARDLGDTINSIHREYPSLQVGATATWAHYVDGLDGDPDLSVVMRSPLDPPGGWDVLNSMTYSSFFPADWRAYHVYLTELAVARRYPSGQVSHLLGLVGGGTPPKYMNFDNLVRDARLSRAMGVREVVVYELDGALKVFGDDFVRRFTAAVNGPQTGSTVAVPFSRPASALLYGMVVADALLDLRGWRGLVWIGWAIASGIIAWRSTMANIRRTSQVIHEGHQEAPGLFSCTCPYPVPCASGSPGVVLFVEEKEISVNSR